MGLFFHIPLGFQTTLWYNRVIIQFRELRMPSFSQASFSKLSTCHHELQVLMYEVIKHFDCTITCGHRNQAEQDKAYAEGKTKLEWPHGKHNQNPSMAVDAAPYPIDWKDRERVSYFGGFVQGVAAGLKEQGKMTKSIRWGGDFNMDHDPNNQEFYDGFHFELI